MKTYILVRNPKTRRNGCADLVSKWVIDFVDPKLCQEFILGCQLTESHREVLSMDRYQPMFATLPLSKEWLAVDPAETLLLNEAICAMTHGSTSPH